VGQFFENKVNWESCGNHDRRMDQPSGWPGRSYSERSKERG
jgi:hypothetical protein